MHSTKSNRKVFANTKKGVLQGCKRRRFEKLPHIARTVPLALITHGFLVLFMWFFLGFDTPEKRSFVYVFFFRYTKLILNTISWRLAQPWPVSLNTPQLSDVSIIIPSADLSKWEVLRCIDSALASGAAKVIVATFGKGNVAMFQNYYLEQSEEHRSRLDIADTGKSRGNKREQIVCGLTKVATPYVIFKDDHVFWPTGPRFVRSILVPFEDKAIAVVGTNKRVTRKLHTLFRPSIVNFLGCLYLDRHNMDTISTNRLDGGVWVISGRTCAFRSEIVKGEIFQQEYLNEYMSYGFGKIGPFNADDDLFITRWMASHGYKIFFQNGHDAMMHTSIDVTWSIFNQKLHRWNRGWGRSNPRSLSELSRIWRFPWTYYAVHISGCINFALVWDPLLLYKLYCAVDNGDRAMSMTLMSGWIVCSKLVKLMPHFSRNPGDLILFPLYCIFAYYMSLIKAWSLFQFTDISWGSRGNVDNVSSRT